MGDGLCESRRLSEVLRLDREPYRLKQLSRVRPQTRGEIRFRHSHKRYRR